MLEFGCWLLTNTVCLATDILDVVKVCSSFCITFGPPDNKNIL